VIEVSKPRRYAGHAPLVCNVLLDGRENLWHHGLCRNETAAGLPVRD
jgi:hypothetical protein